MIFPDRKYGVVYLDPPWSFKAHSGAEGVPTTAAQPYPVMSLGEIAALPVPRLLARDAAVVMWDNDSLPYTLPFLATAWGLRVATKNLFIWDKGDGIGMGYFSRKQGEVAHLLVKGKPKVCAHDVRQIVRAPRREHSRKPDEVRGSIERLFKGPYLEVFARGHFPGWDCAGNETDKFNAEDVLG